MRQILDKPTPALKRANRHASILIEAMLREMESGLRDPGRLQSEQWVRLFGSRQSTVANLQKLVQALAALSDPRTKKTNAAPVSREEEVMNMQDAQIFSAWLSEQRAGHDD